MYNIKFKALSKRGYFPLLALLIAITSFAQEITINGVVIDETDTPLIGATVQVKNTQKGVVTDFDGKFSIKAKHLEVRLPVYRSPSRMVLPVRVSISKFVVLVQ